MAGVKGMKGGGGARPGSGRKLGVPDDPKEVPRVIADRVKMRIARIVEKNLNELLPPILAAAKAGDVAAFKELMDRGIGRSTQSVEMEVEQRKLIQDDMPKSALPSTFQVGVGGILEENKE